MKKTRRSSRRQRGQAMVLLALAFVGLAAFVGLTVDAGNLFAHIGYLRRAVDAASLGAANSFREGRTFADIQAAAEEFVRLNLPGTDVSTQVVVHTCNVPGGNPPPPPEPPISPLCDSIPPRKLVRVRATTDVNFFFLPIVGWRTVPITAEAISETASIDLVVVVDVSPSMSYDLCNDGINNDADWNGPGSDTVTDDCEDLNPGTGYGENGRPEHWVGDPSDPTKGGCRWATTDENKCHPFEEVRAAVDALVRDYMYFPYDRFALVTFGRIAHDTLPDGVPLDWCQAQPSPEACALDAVANMQVEWPPIESSDCPWYPPDPRGCTPTNSAEGLRYAGNQFGSLGRQEAVWVVVFVSDGVANAALKIPSPSPPTQTDWICPPSTWALPFCTDGNAEQTSRHSNASADYDALDAGMDMADFVACLTPPAPGCSQAGNGAVIFSIGLGDAVTNYTRGGDPDAGEDFLRYIAAVGDDGDPVTDPCAFKAVGVDCGNYYHAPSGDQLLPIFEAIASRVFTRINH